MCGRRCTAFVGILLETMPSPRFAPKMAAALAVLLFGSCLPARTATLDTLVFGDSASESAHGLTSNLSEIIGGQLSQTARRLLPKTPAEVNGGDLTFTMAVDPVRRNYFSVRLWGGDDTSDAMGRLYLYVPLDGVTYQVGYRHEGDYMPLSVAASKPPLPGRFFYSTTLLPLWMTKGKTSLTLRIVSTGRLYGLGSGYEGDGGNYQFNMNAPSRGIYRAYTHNEPMLDVSGEVQGTVPAVTTRPAVAESTILGPSGTYTTGLNNWVNDRLGAAATAFTTIHLELLAKAYKTPEVSAAYNNSAVISKIVAVMDVFASCYYAQPSLAFTKGRYLVADGFPVDFTIDGGNEVWGGRFGPLGRVIALLQAPLAAHLDVAVDYGPAAGTKTRRQAWGDMLRASLDYGRFNRRTITNQTILADGHIYKANMGLAALGDSRALTEAQAQRYLKEACGLLPWRGNDLAGGGSALRYGSAYFQVTPKGLTREWGYVGSYGEMARHVATFFELTGNTEFRDQAAKMIVGRAAFRRPAIEVSGSANYRTMERTGLLAWRAVRETDGEFANEINYGEPAAWSGGMRVAALSGEPAAVGYAKQMLADNQYLGSLVSDTRFYRNLTGDALWAFDAFADHAAVKAAADSGVRLPMTDGQQDFVWADEAGGVIALKRGNERMWVAPYWQAKTGTGINGVARFHYSTSNYDQYGVLETTPRFRAGAYFTRPNYVDKPEALGYVPPDAPVNAYAGEVLPLGVVPTDALDGAPFIGRADFYAFRFGPFLFGMNASTNTSRELKTPVGFTSATDLVSGAARSGAVMVGPTNSVVLYLPSAVDPAAVPSTPLLLTASGNSAPSVVLNWSAPSGAEAYTVKRASQSGGPYTAIEEATDIPTTSFTDTAVTSGSAYFYVVVATNANGSSYESMEASASAGIEAPWTAADVGTVGIAGTTSIINDAFTLTGSGGDVGGTADSCHYVSMPWTGDGALIARLTSRVQGGSLNDKFGLMVRESSTTAGSKNFTIRFDGSSSLDRAKVSYRTSTGGSTTEVSGSQEALPKWLKLERAGNTFTGSISSDGAIWTKVGEATFSMTATLRFGMFVCSRDSVAVNVSTFDGVRAPDGWGRPPATPSGLGALAGPSSAGLSWSAVTGAARYNIKRSTQPGGPYTTAGTVVATSFTDTGLVNGITHYYVVSAVNANGESANSSEVEVMPQLGPPPAPTGAIATAGNAVVQLGWNASFQAGSYTVKRSSTAAGPFTTIAQGLVSTAYTDTAVVNDLTYHYVITATGPGGESGPSAIVSARPAAVPPAPSGVVAVPGNGSVVLAWPPALGAQTYTVKRSASSSGPFATIATGLTGNSFADAALTNGTTYFYALTSVSAAGESPNSTPVPATPLSTILPASFGQQDIGAVALAGASSFAGGVFSLVASGTDISGTSDAFRFVYVPVNGDCTVTVRVTSLQNVNEWTKAGLMIRETLDAGSKNAAVVATPTTTRGLRMQSRTTTGGSTVENASTTGSRSSIPRWLRLERIGNTITASRSSSGTSWTVMGSVTVSMTSRVYVGLALTSRDNTRTASATFSNFSVVSSGTLVAPADVRAVSGGGSATLSWSAVAGAVSYTVQRAVSPDGPFTAITTGITGTTYTDGSLTDGRVYYYRIIANSSAGEGWASSLTAAIPRSLTPSGLSATAGNAMVDLTWSPVAGAEGYRLRRATSSAGPFEPLSLTTSTSLVDASVTNGTRYFYTVGMVLGGIEGPASTQVSAIPVSSSTGLAGVWANVSVATNTNRYNVNATNGLTNFVVTDAAGSPAAIAVGDVVSPVNAFAGLGARFCYWVVGTGSNTISISTTPGGPPLAATATVASTNLLRTSQRWSVGANWTNGVIPGGIDAVATFPRGSLPLDVGVVLVDTNVTLGRLVYSNSSNFSDCTLVSGPTNTLRFAVSGTNPAMPMPMIDVPQATQKWLQLGALATNGPALRITGVQGLLVRSSPGGAVTNGLGSNPAKDLSVQNVDWSNFSGGLVVERGSLGPAYTNRLPAQDLTLGTAFSLSNNVLAGLRMSAPQTVGALNGNANGRIWGNFVLTVGASNAGGAFGGVVGQEFNGLRATTGLVKSGTNTQQLHGVMVGNGSVAVNGGTLVFCGAGTSTFSGDVNVTNAGRLVVDATHIAAAPLTNVTLTAVAGSTNFASSIPLRDDDTFRVVSTNAGLLLASEYTVVGTPVASTNVRIAETPAGAPLIATAAGSVGVQHASTRSGTSGRYLIAAGGRFGGIGRIAPFDLTGVTNAAISVAGKLEPGSSQPGLLTLDGSRCLRSLLRFETGATLAFRLGSSGGDAVAISSAQSGDVQFSGNVVDFVDESDGNLPTQSVLFSADAPGAYLGLTTGTDNVITAGLTIGSGLESYPQAALYLIGNNIVLRVTPPPAPAPAILHAVGGLRQIALSWPAAPGADYYAVYRSSSAGGLFDLLTTGMAATNYTDAPIADGAMWFYAVRSLKQGIESDDYAAASARADYSPLQAWRLAQFGTAASAGAAADEADPDSDGMSNLAEFAAGTAPLDAASRFTATMVSGGSGDGSWVMRFPSMTGRQYQILTTTNLVSPLWQPVGNPVAGTGGELVLPCPTADPRGQFYRVRVSAP